MASKLLVVKLVSFMMLFAVSHASFFRLVTRPKGFHSTPTPMWRPKVSPWKKPTPTWHPKVSPWNKPTRELPPSYGTPTPELPPSYNPSPELPPLYTSTPELPPSYMPTPELHAPSPAPY